MTTAIAAPAVSTTIVSPSSTDSSDLPGGSYFKFLNVENLHHRLQAAVNNRIESIRQEERTSGATPRQIFIASRRDICGKPELASVLIEALRLLDVPLLLLVNEQFFSVEVIDLHKCGNENKLRSCGTHHR